MMKTISTLVGLALCLTLTGPANAATRTNQVLLRDGTGDVWTSVVGGDTYTKAPERRLGDIVIARLAHRPHAVVARLGFAELRRSGRLRYEFAIETDSGLWYANVTASRHRWSGTHRLWQNGGDVVACSRMSHHVDYAADLVTLRVPRACIGRPQWVRLVVTAFRESRNVLAQDNPQNHRALPDGFTRRLYRG